MIARILEAVRLPSEESFGRNTKDTPVVKPLLIRDKNRDKQVLLWNYRLVIRILNYLTGSTCLNISIAVH